MFISSCWTKYDGQSSSLHTFIFSYTPSAGRFDADVKPFRDVEKFHRLCLCKSTLVDIASVDNTLVDMLTSE